MLDRELLAMRVNILQINVSQLAPLSRIPAPKLSLFLGGTRGLNNVEIDRLRTTLDDIEQLVQVASPFPIAFRDVGLIKDLISRMRAGEFASREKASEANQ